MFSVNHLDISPMKLFFKSVSRISQALFFVACFIALFFALSVSPIFASSGNLPAPTLISPSISQGFTNPRPIIAGVTLNNTQVDIFIDNQSSGPAIVRNDQSGTANFYYILPANLSYGQHTVHAVAKKDANISQETAKISFLIIKVSAPTLFTPVFNLNTIETKPFVVGLINNNSKVKIYLDDQYDGEMIVKNHPSGVANFAYKPKKALTLGIHQVKATAINFYNNQESGFSSTILFSIDQSFPAPTLFKLIVKSGNSKRPIISGVAKNGNRIDLYINDVKYPINLTDDESGTTYFSYQSEKDLAPKLNRIFAVAFSHQGKMSRQSNLVYWDLSPKEQPVASAETLLKPAVKPKPAPKELEKVTAPESAQTEKTSEPAKTDKVQVEPKDLSQEAKVTIEEETPKPAVSGDVTTTEDVGITEKPTDETAPKEPAAEDLQPGVNWSKIIGLVILAVLIIVLIIQLLKKEGPEDKKGETLKLFNDDKKTESKPKDKSHDNDIPPPPPPSSNLPF